MKKKTQEIEKAMKKKTKQNKNNEKTKKIEKISFFKQKKIKLK